MPYLTVELYNKNFIDWINSNKSLLSFKNGVIDLKTGLFRKRTKEDYITSCLDFDYSDNKDNNLINKIYNDLLKISNNDKDLLNFHLSWLGYCMTDETKEQNLLMVIGHTASNGKSTMAKIFSKVLDECSIKLDKLTFNKNYTKYYKQLIETHRKDLFILKNWTGLY